MDKPAIKKFAIWARNKLIADTKYRAGLVGVTETAVAEPLPQSNETVQFFDVGLPQPYRIEGDAVTQRQRFVAELNKETAKQGSYTAAYQTVVDKVAYTWFNRLIAVRYMEVNDLLPSRTRVLSSADGRAEPQIVTTPFDAVLDYTPAEQQQIVTLKNDNKLDEAFRLLFLKQCAALGDCLPRLFEQVDDYMPLLLALSFTDKDGVVCHLVNDIPESDWQDAVQIVGWLYQYYNTEPKEQVFANLKKNIKISAANIPAATQLFTPDWIVRYMVENSLGRLWSEGHPDFDKSNWKYYLDEAPQEPQVAQQLAELRKGYAALTPEDIKCIDPCMGSGHILAYLFDVLMQIYRSAGYTDRDAAASIVEHNLYGLDIDDRAAQMAYFVVMMKGCHYDSRFLRRHLNPHVYAIQESGELTADALGRLGKQESTARALLDGFKNAKEYGSILQPKVTLAELDALQEQLREKLQLIDTVNMAHLGARGFDEIGGEVVQTTSFVMRSSHTKGYKGTYCRLIDGDSEKAKADMFVGGENRYVAEQDNFSKIPGSPVAYWVSDQFLKSFESPKIGDFVLARNGMKTGDNGNFVRLWWEPNIKKEVFNAKNAKNAVESKGRWFPYNKGGEYRKWYGNSDCVVNWENAGERVIGRAKIEKRNVQDYPIELKFKPLVTWSLITSSLPSFRYKESCICDIAGMSFWDTKGKNTIPYLLALCNSKVAFCVLKMIAPTINFQAGDISRIPVIISTAKGSCVQEKTEQCISLSKSDWDSFETSWDFKRHPLV